MNIWTVGRLRTISLMETSLTRLSVQGPVTSRFKAQIGTRDDASYN